jgi:hypothetical protein
MAWLKATIHARMVMKTMLNEVKTTIGPSKGSRTSTWWSADQGRVGHTSISWRLRRGYATMKGLAVSASKPRVLSIWTSKPESGRSAVKWWYHEVCLYHGVLI